MAYLVALVIGLLAVTPPIPYHLPVILNSFAWLHIVIISGLLGMLLLRTDLPALLKILTLYLLVMCFFSQVPYNSFNAYILVVVSCYFFLLARRCNHASILNMIEAVFWFEVIIIFIQLVGKDTILNFDRRETLFFGTVMQPMRLGSMFACMTPFLIIKDKRYIIPILILSVISKTLGFSLAVAFGIIVFIYLTDMFDRIFVTILIFTFCILCSIYSFDHIRWEALYGRWPVWGVVIKSWAFETYHKGEFSIKNFLFGHGLDTFNPMFRLYKHDPNPFPEVHNDWLQIIWETGFVGFSLLTGYVAHLIYRLYERKNYLLISGCAVIAVNMFFHFPLYQAQCVILILCWVALCERKLDVDTGLKTLSF